MLKLAIFIGSSSGKLSTQTGRALLPVWPQPEREICSDLFDDRGWPLNALVLRNRVRRPCSC
jgi:hypothetical protein